MQPEQQRDGDRLSTGRAVASCRPGSASAEDPADIHTYDYELPPELIADRPALRRDSARLLVVDRAAGRLHHARVADLPELLNPGDCLVLNDTRVVPARLCGRRVSTGGRWEGLFVSSTADGDWRIIGQTRGRLRPGEELAIPAREDADQTPELVLRLLRREEDGIWLVRPRSSEGTWAVLERYGSVPLPPYIGRKEPRPEDKSWYQTIYARHPGAVAAPTAGLHFTPQLLERCRQHGIQTAFVTLHVGLGTFRPVTAPRLDQHRMHAEWCRLDPETVRQLAEIKNSGGRIVAVGTTAVRTLETAARNGCLEPWEGCTDLFIAPPYRFRAVDALLTNFHLPRSTLLVLVSAFAGIERIRRAYAEAIGRRYRFYSYGDAMLLL